LKAKFRSRAKDEYHAAFAWYEAENTAAAARFAEAVRQTIGLIERSPLIGRRIVEADDPRTRQLPVAGFPYFVIFVPLKTRISIVAIAHYRRERGYWL